MLPRLNAMEIDMPPLRPGPTLSQGSAAARDRRSFFPHVRAQDRSRESKTLRFAWASRSNRGAGDFVAEVGQLSGWPTSDINAMTCLHMLLRLVDGSAILRAPGYNSDMQLMDSLRGDPPPWLLLVLPRPPVQLLPVRPRNARFP